MRNLLFILLILPSVAMVQPANVDSITKAIKTGNVEQLARYFDDNVEIAIMGDVYDKSDAKAALQRFFKQHKPQKFDTKHKGVSKGKSSEYIIGDLVTQDESYRLYLQMKVENGTYVVEELQIDED